MEKHAVALAAEVLEGRAKLVRVRGVEVGLFRVGDACHAYRNVCPHAAAPICGGKVTAGILRCPWHGWEFDLRTGAHVRVPAERLQSYRVEVEDGRLFVWA